MRLLISLFFLGCLSSIAYAVENAPEKGDFLILLKSTTADKTLPAALAATPGVIRVFSYPNLTSYVVKVKNIEAARPYLEKLSQQQPSIYRVDQLFPSSAELEVSPTAINIRTQENPYGSGWWQHRASLPVTVAIWDGGVDGSHPALAHVKTFCQPTDETNPDLALCAKDLASAHGTSLAGIYASTLDHYPGIASYPALQNENFREAGNIQNFLIAEAEGREGNPLQGLAWLLQEDHPPFQVANYSYGNGNISDTALGCHSGSYSALAEIFDRTVNVTNATIVKSAGNNKYSAANCTMTIPGDAYNVIAVANINPFDWQQCARGGERNNAKIHEGSSVNAPYNQDSRRLLHIAAPGRYINTSGLDPQYCKSRCDNDAACETECDSLGAETQGAGNGFWRVTTGTSMSTPMVGAVAALLNGSNVTDASAIKAIIINSADSWTSNDTPHPISPDATRENPNCTDANAAFHYSIQGSHYDRSYGWGVLNADNAYLQRENVHIDSIASNEIIEYTGSLKDFEKATLVWQKTYGQSLNTLHLTLKYKEGDEWKTLMTDESRVDNVKQVSNGTEGRLNIPPVNADLFLLQVRAENIPNNGTQRFALVSTQAFNGNTNTAPIDASQFMLEVTLNGSGTETFALVSTQVFS